MPTIRGAETVGRPRLQYAPAIREAILAELGKAFDSSDIPGSRVVIAIKKSLGPHGAATLALQEG